MSPTPHYIETYQLDAPQLQALESLGQRCQAVDGHQLVIYPHLLSQLRPLAPSLLLYDHQQLIGFIGVFFFYEHACEIVLMIDPAYRRQHWATYLLVNLMPFIEIQQISTLIFSAPHALHDTWLSNLGFHYQGTEYQMEKTLKNWRLSDKTQTITTRVATESDIPMIALIDQACFQTNPVEMQSRLKNRLHDPQYCILLAYQDGVPVGKAHLFWRSPEHLRLSDIAILPRLQGRGLGTALLTQGLQYAQQRSTLTAQLDVETHNKRALNLYTGLGFKTKSAQDYWKIALIKLQQSQFYTATIEP